MYRQFEHLCRAYADWEGRGLLGSFRHTGGDCTALSENRAWCGRIEPL